MLWIGTSGWQYGHWKETFYPREVKQAEWLEYYAARFRTVELNNAFYRLPEDITFEAWERRTPLDFVMAVKMSRYLTHIRRLDRPEEPVFRFLSRATALGRKLGPVLLQLPPTMQIDVDRLANTLDQFPERIRVAVEFRHPSWFVPKVRELLESRRAALCLADSPRRETPAWATTSWGFARLHEGTGTPRPCYRRAQLEEWVERIASCWRREDDVFVYFNNDPRACALRDAIVFAEIAQHAGLSTTRVPSPGDVHVSPE